MSQMDFLGKVHAERARQIELGYTIEHDDGHGLEHLLYWAQVYGISEDHVKSQALLMAAREYVERNAGKVVA